MNSLDLSVAWTDVALMLISSATMVWLLAEIISRRTTSAAWQRALWQTAVLSLGGLLACELCGIGPAIQEGLRLASGGREPPGALGSEMPATAREIAGQHGKTVAVGNEELSADYSVLSMESVFSTESVFNTKSVVGAEPAMSVLPSAPSAIDTPIAHVTALPKGPDASRSLWGLAAVIVWVFGGVLLLARLAVGQALLMTFGRRCSRGLMDKHIDPLRITRLARQVGLARRVRIIWSPALSSPVAFGLWRPTIGLPTSFEREFSPQQQDAMLAHELAHLAHADPAWRLLGDLIVTALWWHPAAWLIRWRLQAACEVAADEACLVVEDGPELLAGCLVTLARRVSPAPAPGWLAVEGNGFRSSLGRRVCRLLSLSPAVDRPAWKLSRLVCVLGALVLVTAALVSTAWARPQVALTGESSMRNILARSWRQSLASGLLLAVLGPASPAVADDEPKKEDRPAAEGREGDRPEARREGERRDGDRPAAERREGERRDGDRPPAERRDGDRPPAERRDGERPPMRRDGERPDAARPRDGEGSKQRLEEERRRIEEHLERMGKEVAELTRAGKRDAAEGLEREMTGMRRRLEALRRAGQDRPDGPPEGRRPDGPPPEGRRPDGPRPEGRRPDGPPPEGRRPDGPPPEGRPGFPPGPPRDELISLLRELRAEVQTLRQEVNALKSRMEPRGEGERR